MNKTKIEWCDYTWNPAVGCKHNCKYCYAEKINNRFKHIPEWTDPVFYPDRLKKPYGKYPPTKTIPFRKDNKSLIFVVSMGDLFGDWVADFWIQAVLETVQNNPQHEFMFLTKNPKRYRDFMFPKNSWIGATVEKYNNGKMAERMLDLLLTKTNTKIFLSIEPILGIFPIDLVGFDLVIIGAMTGPRAIKPEKEWIESIKHSNIFYKENIKQYL